MINPFFIFLFLLNFTNYFCVSKLKYIMTRILAVLFIFNVIQSIELVSLILYYDMVFFVICQHCFVKYLQMQMIFLAKSETCAGSSTIILLMIKKLKVKIIT